jgi:hypothetical protein
MARPRPTSRRPIADLRASIADLSPPSTHLPPPIATLCATSIHQCHDDRRDRAPLPYRPASSQACPAAARVGHAWWRLDTHRDRSATRQRRLVTPLHGSRTSLPAVGRRLHESGTPRGRSTTPLHRSDRPLHVSATPHHSSGTHRRRPGRSCTGPPRRCTDLTRLCTDRARLCTGRARDGALPRAPTSQALTTAARPLARAVAAA